MDVSWAFVVLLLYPALQLPAVWYIVHRYDLRNDDGPEPVGYSFHDGEERTDESGPGAARARARPGRCRRCGASNDPAVRFCGACLAPLGRAPRRGQ